MEFPWLHEIAPAPETKTPPGDRAQPGWRRVFATLRPHASKIGLFGLLIALALVGRCSNSKDSEVHKTSEPDRLLMSLVAIPRGHVIPVEALSEIPIRAGTLSKAQRLRALVPEHLTKLRYAIVAKKDIAPETPIFWTDLMLTPAENPARIRTKTRIFFNTP